MLFLTQFVCFLFLSALADMLFIYPFKADKKTFDDNKDELGFASKPREVKKRKTTKEIEIDRLQKLRKEELYYKSKCARCL